MNRREHTGFIEQFAAEFRRRPWMWLALGPEGTRARTEHWKSGFYHLALAASVPVGLGFLDYGRRIAGVTSWLSLSGDQGQDLAHIRAFYADKTAGGGLAPGRLPCGASRARERHRVRAFGTVGFGCSSC